MSKDFWRDPSVQGEPVRLDSMSAPAKLPHWCVIIIDRTTSKVAHVEGPLALGNAEVSASRMRRDLTVGEGWDVQVSRFSAPGEPE